jgi:Nitroreductase family
VDRNQVKQNQHQLVIWSATYQESQFMADAFCGPLILIAATSPGPWVIEDCALAAENLMLAAYAAGLGARWIGFAQGFRRQARRWQDFRRPACRGRRSPSVSQGNAAGTTQEPGHSLDRMISAYVTEPSS